MKARAVKVTDTEALIVLVPNTFLDSILGREAVACKLFKSAAVWCHEGTGDLVSKGVYARKILRALDFRDPKTLGVTIIYKDYV